MSTSHTVYISLGSNKGDTARNLRDAMARVDELPGVSVVAESQVYLTEPQESTDQAYFTNAVIKCVCLPDMAPQTLMTHLLQIEAELGRDRSEEERNGPRPIDLDLLIVDGLTMETALLTLPHPRMHLRAFVLVPLAEIAPDLALPCGRTVKDALAGLSHSIQGRVIYQPAR